MSLLACVATHIAAVGGAASPCLAQLLEGMATAQTPAGPGAALADAGEEAAETDILGHRTVRRAYVLTLRDAALTEEGRARLQACAETLARALNAAEAPALPAGCTAEALSCAGVRETIFDAGGLASAALALRLVYTEREEEYGTKA